jgi:hypothetical protein
MSTPEEKEQDKEKANGEAVVAVTSELKHIVPAPEPIPSEVPAAEVIGPETVFTGEILKQVREARRLTLKEISDRTRISVASLAALEAERFEDLPNARVYVRGFVRCVAVEIGLDREQVSRTYLPRWQAWYEAQHVR